MLFCDACDKGYHMTCHEPAIEDKPQGKFKKKKFAVTGYIMIRTAPCVTDHLQKSSLTFRDESHDEDLADAFIAGKWECQTCQDTEPVEASMEVDDINDTADESRGLQTKCCIGSFLLDRILNAFEF